ncbi:MAG TPA: hypothetical protein VFU61_08780 [Steroidobacteraceae bacterium]|nr:hypothetical protein [Steroidobacteraceae bacterium]
MGARTIGVMGRLLDQADGLGLYARYLLKHLVSLDSGSRYVIFLASHAARGLPSSDWYVNPGNYPWWDNIYIRAMLPLYCRKARAILAISQVALDDLARHGLKLPRTAFTHAGIGPRFTADAEVTGSQALRQQMRAAGLERARRFDWPQAAQRVLEAFDMALSANRSQPSAAALRR